MAEVKRRRITAKDWGTVESYIESELSHRRSDPNRQAHEAIWKEVDRQVAMKPMKRIVHGEEVSDWHSTVELGELAKASEVLTADVRRMIFPHSRAWFDPHVDIDDDDPVEQKQTDGALRAFMGQQHVDFGLKARFELSVKEALHHGSFVAEAVWMHRAKITGGEKVENIAAPVWVPHSMWNCYPDPSPSVIGTDMFYSGSMMIVSYSPRHKVMEMAKGEGWFNLDKIPKVGKDEDDQIVTYYGDLVIRRQDGEIFLPNSKVVTANKRVIYYAPIELPYPPIIYAGYERIDVRDPYYTSPIVKLSPMQKLGSVMANKFIESISLKVEPPIVYDASDPYFVESGGPVIAPGYKSATKGTANWKAIEVGDPNAASAGLTLAIRQIQEGTGVNAVRAGGTTADRKTATEIERVSQAGEIRTVDFVDKLESQGLRPFLYMQHALNRKHLTGYSFYNSEMDAPDFMRASRQDMPESVHFDVVGSKGLLGEEARTQKTSAVTAFASGNQLFAPLLKPEALLVEMYQDAGNKNPERFIKTRDGQDPELAQMQQQAEAVFQQLQQQAQQEIQKLQQRIQELESKQAIEAAKLQQKAQSDEAEIALKRETTEAELRLKQAQAELEIRSRERIEMMKLGIKTEEEMMEPGVLEQMLGTISESSRSGSEELAQAIAQLAQQQQAMNQQHTQEFLQGLQSVLSEINRPKRLVRDDQGRPIGVESV